MTVTNGTVGIDQLRTTTNDAVPLLVSTWQETGHINEGDHRNIEGIAGTHKSCCLFRSINVEAACKLHRLVGNDTHDVALDAAKPDHDVGSEKCLDFEEVAIVHHVFNDGTNVIGLVG